MSGIQQFETCAFDGVCYCLCRSRRRARVVAARHGQCWASAPFELSRLLGIDTGLMTRMLDKLEIKGLLERSRSIEDRRVVNLKLTDEGEAIAERLPEIAPVVLNRRLKKFTKAEFEELRRLLNKFLAE